jgi:hypothetical protein
MYCLTHLLSSYFQWLCLSFIGFSLYFSSLLHSILHCFQLFLPFISNLFNDFSVTVFSLGSITTFRNILDLNCVAWFSSSNSFNCFCMWDVMFCLILYLTYLSLLESWRSWIWASLYQTAKSCFTLWGWKFIDSYLDFYILDF